MHYESDSLEHHGVKGQKWGIRRYVNPDGTLTTAGKVRLSSSDYDNMLYYDTKNKNRNEATKILRKEKRNMELYYQKKSMIRAAGVVGSYAAGILGGTALAAATANPILAPIGIGVTFTGWIANGVGGVLDNLKQKELTNVLNTKLDELNIDNETQRRLNL